MDRVTTQRKKESRALKLLSLDGGGVRGLSSLMILRALMTSLNRGRASPTEPWQEFDLIAGTSTGGLLAIMLGRLRMSIAECEKAYIQLAEAIFTPRRQQMNIPGKAIDFLKVNGKFHEQPLEDILKQKIMDAGLDADALLEDVQPGSCKVFVCATQVFDNSPTLLRSYENTMMFGDITDVKIWEAGRATSAASSFFDPITIGPMGEKYADGALHYNNPIELVLQESLELWPDNDRVLVSIGTGSAPGQAIDGSLKSLVSQLVRIATETEETARAFLRSHGDMVRANRLFRFNVHHGLGEIGLDESKEMPKIAARTRTYLRDPEVTQKAYACVTAMKENPGIFGCAELSLTPEPLSKGGDESVDLSGRSNQAGASGSSGAVGGAEVGGHSLDSLRDNPQFQQLLQVVQQFRQVVQQNPQMLNPILQQIAAGNPQLAKLIVQHPEEFLQLLQEAGDNDAPTSSMG